MIGSFCYCYFLYACFQKSLAGASADIPAACAPPDPKTRAAALSELAVVRWAFFSAAV